VGVFADRFHPMRVTVIGMLLTAVTYFCCFFWINDQNSLLVWWSVNQIAIAVFLGAATALSPRLLPRERYGQFVSANLIFGMIGLVFAPPFVGALMQWIADYRYSFLFCGVSCTLSLAALLVLQAQWEKYGGARNYVPPDPSLPAAPRGT